MQTIPRDLARKYAFDWEDQPLLKVKTGESFQVETWDASTGYLNPLSSILYPLSSILDPRP